MLKHLRAASCGRQRAGSRCNGRLSALIEVGAGFHPDLTGRENVFLNGVILGMTPRRDRSASSTRSSSSPGLAPFIDTPVKRYSSGMFARLGFSVAAHLDPDILVIDEVLSVGDFVFQQKSLQKMRSIATGGATVVFVSHNLKAASDLCARAILIDDGQIVEDGPTPHVIQTYLARERSKLEGPKNTEVAIRAVRLRGAEGERVHFAPGQSAWVDVEFSATQRTEKIAVVIGVLDESLNIVFHTSSERLGAAPVVLDAGQRCTASFELVMHLAAGTFHLAVHLYRYDIAREYDKALPACTFFMSSEVDVRGAANLYPRLISCQVA